MAAQGCSDIRWRSAMRSEDLNMSGFRCSCLGSGPRKGICGCLSSFGGLEVHTGHAAERLLLDYDCH